MKKKLTTKLRLSKETLRNLSDRETQEAVGGATAFCTAGCVPTGATECYECGPRTALSGGSCPTGMACCY